VGYEAGLYDVERENWSPGIYRGSERRVIMHPKVALEPHNLHIGTTHDPSRNEVVLMVPAVLD
jgi:hypothetical protein